MSAGGAVLVASVTLLVVIPVALPVLDASDASLVGSTSYFEVARVSPGF